MKSKTTDRFWKCYAELSIIIKKQVKEAYKLFVTDPLLSKFAF